MTPRGLRQSAGIARETANLHDGVHCAFLIPQIGDVLKLPLLVCGKCLRHRAVQRGHTTLKRHNSHRRSLHSDARFGARESCHNRETAPTWARRHPYFRRCLRGCFIVRRKRHTKWPPHAARERLFCTGLGFLSSTTLHRQPNRISDSELPLTRSLLLSLDKNSVPAIPATRNTFSVLSRSSALSRRTSKTHTQQH